MDASERALFSDAIRRATVAQAGVTLDGVLGELGWVEALADDRASAVAVLFEAQGKTNATSSALDQVLSDALGVPNVATMAVVLPPLGTVEAPGRIEGARVAVRGLGTKALAYHDTALLVVAGEGGAELFVIPRATLRVEATSGLDAALGLVEVSGELDPASLPDPDAIEWSTALAVGQLALGHELVGTGRAMLELARQHALERIQFGRPIASFQAVRHRLAESLVALEAAAALLAAAWDEPSPATAAMAKAMAGRSARTVARHCQQVLAGIGFTTEHSLHRFVRRTYVLDQLLGSGSVLTRQLGAEVLAARSLPAAFPL
jgi:hypothetical protein